MTTRTCLAMTGLLLAALASPIGLAGCEGGAANPGIGTIGGAAAGGALAGTATRNSNAFVQTAAIVGGALVGGAAGDRFIDGPQEQKRIAQSEARADAAMRRQLAFERESALQAERTRQEIEEQRLFNEWRNQRGAATN